MDVCDLIQDNQSKELKNAISRVQANIPKSKGLMRCTDCEEEISQKRLQAVPSASRCTECQMQFERIIQ